MEKLCPDHTAPPLGNDRQLAGLTIRRVPLASLYLDPANARSHPDANMAAIEGSLQRF